MKLEDWKEAVKAATAALDGLDKLQGKGNEGGKDGESPVEEPEEEADEEIISEGATKAEDTSDKGKREADIDRIRGKALMRRARANSELGGWAALQSAESGICLLSWVSFAKLTLPDYKLLSTMQNLSAADKKLVQRQLFQLPPRLKAAQEKEMGEMMGKLKEVSIPLFDTQQRAYFL